jgi:outer membrane receptor protein involved in Fe transport
MGAPGANSIRPIVAVIIAALVGVAPAAAQIRTADIVGVVTDSSGSVVPGASVVLLNLGTNQERTAVSDPTGNFLFTLLPPGRYSVRAELSGFKTWSVAEVTLAAGDKLTLDPKLDVGQATETVSVQAESPTIQRQSTTITALVDEKAVQDLPLNGRNFITLAQLAPGAADTTVGFSTGTTPDDRRLSSQLTVNGQYAWANNYMIDGMDNNERFIGTVIVKPSVEAVQEMRVQTNLYSAEIGRTAGGAVNLITKSGTNTYHGTAYDFVRNEKFDAKDFFAPVKLPYRQTQAGGSIGGPLQKDRLFFFADYEGLRITQGQTFIGTVPTAAMRQGNFAGIARIYDPLTTNCVGNVCTRTEFEGDQIRSDRLDSVALKAMALYPLPTSSALANNYVSSGNRTVNQDTADGKVDYRMTTKDSMFVRYSYTANDVSLPAIYDAGAASTSDQKTYGLQANYIRVLSNRSVAELRGGWSRYDILSLPSHYGQNLSEQLGIRNANVNDRSSGLSAISPNGFSGLGDGGFIPELDKNDVYQVGGTLSNQHGVHSMKFGAEFRERVIAMSQSATPRGSFTFNQALTQDNPLAPSAGTGNSIASMLLGYPNVVSRTIQVVDPIYQYVEFGAYAQDDWRWTRWLTVNAGLRYDYYSPVTEQKNQISNFDFSTGRIVVAGQNGVGPTAGLKKDWINLAPRLGAAATLHDKTVLRGGYGLTFVPPFMGTPGAYRNPPFVSLYSSVAAVTVPTSTFADGLPVLTPADPNNPIGALAAVGFNFQIPYVHQFNLTAQRELPLGLIGSVSYVGQRGKKQFFPNSSPDLNAPAPGNPATVAQRRPYRSTVPNVTTIGDYGNFAGTRYNAMQVTIERRFRNGFGATANYTLAHAEDNFDYRPMDTGAVLLWADSNLDIRHRFTVTANYQLPFAHDATGVLAAVAKGWQLNAIGQMQSSVPFSVVNTIDVAGTGAPGTTPDRPNLIGDPVLPENERTIARYFDTTAFQRQTVGTYGNLARNTLRGPGLIRIDLSGSKTFQLPGTLNLQFTAQAFNVFNHTNFGLPNGQLGNGAFGTITTAQAARQLQFAVKLSF